MKIQFILYVANQEKSKIFYSKLFNIKPILDVEGMTEFKLNRNTKLGLMPEKSIGRVLNNMPKPETGNGIPRCELYIYTNDVSDIYEKSIILGAKEISLPKLRDWGDFVGYVADFDGNIIAFAKNN